MDTKEPLVDSGEERQPEGNGKAGDPAGSKPAASDLQTIIAERDHLIEEKNDLLERLLRRQAEFDNFRRRAERERADVLEYAHAESVGAILPILDDFERAL